MTDPSHAEVASGRELIPLHCPAPEDLLSHMSWPNHRFVCLLAWDADNVPKATITKVARHLLSKGCVYICTWGAGSEHVHDIFDLVDIELNPKPPWIMSTWHHDELSEAIWFALYSAWPDDAFFDDCKSTIGLSIGNVAWATEIREAFEHPHEFNERILAAE